MFVEKDDGFTILELITAVGVLLIFAVTGFSMYGRIQNDSVKASLQQVARGTLTKATGYLLDGDSNTAPEKAAADYNDQQEKNKDGKPTPMFVDVFHDTSTDLITVTATHTSSGISESVSSADPDGNSNGEGDNENVDTPPIVGSDTVTKMKYVCDDDTTGSMGAANIRSDTKLALHGSDGSADMLDIIPAPGDAYGIGVKTTTEQTTLKAGVEYTFTVDGHFEMLTHVYDEGIKDCATQIERIAKDSGIITLSGIGGKKLTDVPDNIPNTVRSLKQAFRGISTLEDGDVNSWDTSNVVDMSYAFRESTFNQPLNNWNTSNVTLMNHMFYLNPEFNQPLDNWDTGKVRTMSYMFNGTIFDQDISSWDVSKVDNFSHMFRNSVFNQPLNEWDVSGAVALNHMFYVNSQFNQPLDKWDTSNAEAVNAMFNGATSFDQDISMWNVDKVTVFTSFANNSPINKTDKVPEKIR